MAATRISLKATMRLLQPVRKGENNMHKEQTPKEIPNRDDPEKNYPHKALQQ